MMEIKGIDGLSVDQLNFELQNGGRFVIFEYCISIIFMTLRRPSAVFFLRGSDSPFSRGLPYSACSLLLGWWGIPWGPIYTLSSCFNNSRGGRDVTQQVIHALSQPAPTQG